MGLMARMLAGLHAMTAPEVEKSSPGVFASLFAHALENTLLDGALSEPYRQHPTVHAAVAAIGGNLAGVPLEFFPDGDEERERPVVDSVVGALIRKPGEEFDGNQLLEATIIHRELDGEAFWFLDADARRTAGARPFPTRITLWEPSNVRHVVEGGRVIRWDYTDQDGKSWRATPDRIVHFRYFNPYNRWRGLGRLQAAMIIARADFKGMTWNEALFDNHAVPYGMLTPEPGQIVQKDAMTRLRTEIEGRHGGGPRQHGKIGATNVPLRWLEIGMSSKDLDFPLLLDAATEKILMVFRVPPTVAGVSKNANYQEATRQAKQFFHNHLPTLDYMEAVIKRRLCEPFGIAETPFFKKEAIKALVEDQLQVAETARHFWNMGVSFRDINDRMELGYPAEGAGAETGFVPFSLVSADQQAMAEPGGEFGGPSRLPAEGDENNRPGDPPTQDDKRLRLVKGGRKSEVFRAMNWKTLIARVYEEERAFGSRIRAHDYALKVEVLRNLGTAKSMKADESPAEFSIEAVLFDRDKAADDVRNRTAPVYRSAAQKGMDSVLAEVGVEIDFNLLTDEVTSFLAEKRFKIADLVDRPIIDRLKVTLQEGLSRGESIQKIAARVEEVFQVERSRAERIARTEVAEAFNGGRYETMKVAGVEKIEWLTARDARVRDEHVKMDGETIRLGDTFSNGLRYPLDPSGPPEQIVNCRCVPLPAA